MCSFGAKDEPLGDRVARLNQSPIWVELTQTDHARSHEVTLVRGARSVTAWHVRGEHVKGLDRRN